MNSNNSTHIGILILRLGVGVLMLLHGIYKLMNGIGPIEQQVVAAGLPAFFAYGVYVGEVFAPILIILGVATRPAALVLVINCIVAILMVHSQDVLTLSPQGGWALELLGLYMTGAIALIFTGGGKFAFSNKYMWD